jgi:hypothetical protein
MRLFRDESPAVAWQPPWRPALGRWLRRGNGPQGHRFPGLRHDEVFQHILQMRRQLGVCEHRRRHRRAVIGASGEWPTAPMRRAVAGRWLSLTERRPAWRPAPLVGGEHGVCERVRALARCQTSSAAEEVVIFFFGLRLGSTSIITTSRCAQIRCSFAVVLISAPFGIAPAVASEGSSTTTRRVRR